MRLSVLSLFAVMLAAQLGAAPTITGFNPQEGFSYAPTTVTITGSGFTDGAVTVFFDDVQATVLHVTSTTLQVVAHPTVTGVEEDLADLTVRVAGQGEAKITNAFAFHPLAQASPSDYIAAIVPLTGPPTPGAHSSVWESELRIFNASHLPLRMPGPETFIVELPIDPAVLVEPRRTQKVLLNRREPGVDGHFLYIPYALSTAPKMSLRVRDTSENATSLGDDVPIARLDQAAGDVTLIDIPVDSKYRATLRIYAFTAAPMRVGVKIYRESGDTPLSEFDVELHGIQTIEFVPFPPHPAYLALDPLVPAARAAGGRVRIELTNYGANVSPPLPNIWAFVSLTNNETNQVTMVTPK
jgi:hypothetical protein